MRPLRQSRSFGLACTPTYSARILQAVALAKQLEDLRIQMDMQAITSMLRACSSGHAALQFFRHQEELNSEVIILASSLTYKSAADMN